MASPSSPYRLSPSSACSSTLIMTPAPPHHHQRGPAPKGHLQPHISNLPRRRRAHRATTLRISAPPAPSSSSLSPLPKEDNDLNANSTSSSYAPSPIQIPSLFPFSKGGLMPPRNGGLGSQGIWQAYRNSPTTASSSSPHRGRKRALQELGYGSGYFLAFEKLGSGEEGDDDEDMAFGATIRITHEEEVDDEACVIEDKRGDDDNGAELRLVVFGSSSREDGVPNLTPAQLRAAVAFGRRQRENGVNQVLITVAPRHSVDALSVGACCIASAVPRLEDPDPAVFKDELLDENEDADADVERIHQLLVAWHDMPVEELVTDGRHLGGGLGDAWRGLLSRDGIEYLASAMRGADALPTPVSFSPPTSPLPSPSA